VAGSKLEAIRAELPAVSAASFLNTGAFGPMARRTQAAMDEEARLDLERGRAGQATYDRMRQTRERARAAFARVLGCEPSELALTHSTTEGINIAVAGLDWQPGDRLVTALAEHPAELNPASMLRVRRGVELVGTDIGLPGVDHVAALEAALEGGARAVLLSHVCWTTGIVMPVRQLADAAHRAGAVLIIDGAQGAGQVPVDVKAMGVDAYAASGQKWLCGPSGTGALYVSPECMDDVGITFAGYAAGTASRDLSAFEMNTDAHRYEAITLHSPSVAALLAGLEWIQDEVGLAWAHERIAALGRRCHDALAALPNVTTLCPPEEIAGLVSFRVDGMPPPEVTAALEARSIFIRHVEYPSANRISTGFYNSEEEIDATVAAIGELAPD